MHVRGNNSLEFSRFRRGEVTTEKVSFEVIYEIEYRLSREERSRIATTTFPPHAYLVDGFVYLALVLWMQAELPATFFTHEQGQLRYKGTPILFSDEEAPDYTISSLPSLKMLGFQ